MQTKTPAQERRDKIVFGVLAVFIFLVIWYLVTKLTAFGEIFPDPITVLANIGDKFVHPLGKVTLLGHILVSIRRVMAAFVVAAVGGIILGVTMGWYPVVEAIFKPIIEFLRPIPPIAWIPISILWYGFSEMSKYFLIFLASFFVITISVYSGVKSVDPMLIRAARMLGAKDNQLFTTIIIPSVVPYIFSGLQVALGNSWASIVAAEMVQSDRGVGWIIITGQQSSNMVQIVTGIVCIAVVGMLLVTIMRGLENKLCAWNKQGR
ncbi:MAG: ABC transporter permease [Ruminococcus sp.]